MAFHAWFFTAYSFLVRYSLKPPLHIAFSSQDALGAHNSDRVKQICAGNNVTNCERQICVSIAFGFTLQMTGSPAMAVPQFSAETHPRFFTDLPVFLESFILRPPPNTAFYSCLDAFGALRCVLEHKNTDFGVMLRMKGRTEGAGLGRQAVLCALAQRA